MAGPSLQLGVGASGQDAIAALNRELVGLKNNLNNLKTAGRADLSNLAAAAADIRKMGGEFTAAGAGVKTALAEIAASVRGGISDIAAAITDGTSRLSSAASAQRRALQEEFTASLSAYRTFASEEVRLHQEHATRMAALAAAAPARAAQVAQAALPVAQPAVVPVPQLGDAGNQLNLLRRDLANQSAGMQTAMADLAETIRGGFQRVANETQVGAAKPRSIVKAERDALQAEYEKMIAQGREFTNAEVAVMRELGIRLTVADRELAAQRLATRAQTEAALGQAINPVRAPISTAADSEITAAYAQHQAQMAAAAGAAKAAAWAAAERDATTQIEAAQLQGFRGFAAMERRLAADRVAVAAAAAEAAATGIAAADAAAYSANGARSMAITRAREATEADQIYKAAAIASATRTAAEVAASKEAAWAQYESQAQAGIARVELESARGFTVIEREATATRLAAARAGQAALAAGIVENDAYIAAVEARTARDLAAVRAATEKIARAEAGYQAAAASRQGAAQIGARAQLDQGVAPLAVAQNFGTTATEAARTAASLESLRTAHAAAGNEAAKATPQFMSNAAAMRDLNSAARGAASGFNAMFLTYGQLVPLLAGAALSNSFVQVVRLGAEVDHQMGQIRILAGASSEEVAGLNKQLLDMASNGVFGPQAIAEAFKNLTLAGLSISQQRTAINDVVNFAIAGTTTIEHASEALVQISTAFGYTAESYSRVGDVIAKAAAISLSSVETLTRSMQSASEVHTLYGQSLVDVATNLAALSQLGIRGTAAGTALKNMYAELSGSTSIVRRNIQAYNLDILDQNGKIKGLIPLLETLSAKYNSLKGAAQTRFIQDLSNSRGGKDMAALLVEYNKLDAQGKHVLEQSRQDIEQSYGFSAIAAATLAVTAKSQMESVSASFQSSLVKSFSAIEPSIISISGKLRGIFNSAEFQTSVQNLAVTVANVGVYLIEHVTLITNIVKAIAVWKAATIGMSVIEGLIGYVTRAGASFASMATSVLTATGVMGANTTALAANATAIEAANAAGVQRAVVTRESIAASVASATALTEEAVAARATAVSAQTNAVALTEQAAASRAVAVSTQATAIALAEEAGAQRTVTTTAQGAAAALTEEAAAGRANAIAAQASAVALAEEAAAARAVAIAQETSATAQLAAERATIANTTAIEANAVASRGALVASSGLFAKILGAIPIIGGIAIAGSIAMDLFWSSASGKKANVDDSFDEKARQVLGKLKAQSDLAKANFVALSGGIGDTARGDAATQGKEYINDLEATIQKREAEVVKVRKKLEDQQKLLNAPLMSDYTEGAGLEMAARDNTKVIQAELETAQSRLRSAVQLKNDITYEMKTLVQNTEGVARLADEKARIAKSAGTGDNPKKPVGSGVASSELSSLRGVYQAQESEAKSHYDRLQKIEDAQHSSGMISDIQYQIESEQIQQQSFTERQALLTTFISRVQSALAILRADPKKNAVAIGVEAKLEIDLSKQQDELDLAKQLTATRKEGAEFKRSESLNAFIEQQQSELDQARQIADVRERLSTMGADDRAIEEARLAAQDKFNGKLREEQTLLASVQGYLFNLDALGDDSGEAVTRAQAELARIRTEIARLKTAQNSAGNQAAADVKANQKSPWERNLEEFLNVTEQMKKAYDEVVQGFIDKGRDMWSDIVKTGKVSIDGLLEMLRDTIAKEIYNTTIAPAMANVGKQVAGALFGDRGKGGGLMGTVSPVDAAATTTASSLNSLTATGVTPLQSAFTTLIAIANQLGTAMANAAAKAGFGGGGLSDLFNGGNGMSGSGTGLDYNYGSMETGWALGGAFGAAEQFAKGSAFTNRTFSQTTPFHFARGRGFSRGQMGEAGPEAVMPLKRGADGSLGVAMHSQAQQSNVSIVIEHHGEGAKSTTKETKRSDGSREVRVIIDATKKEIINDMHSGGDFATAGAQQYGWNRTAGLPRRST